MTGQSTIGQWIKENKAILVLALVILLGAFLRIYDLGAESFWNDEVSSIYESTLSMMEISARSNHPPLYFILLGWWINLWGTGEIATRSLSVIFGILAIFITYLVGKELLGQKAGLIASFIAAISQFYIYFSQEVRSYSLLLLLSLLSYLFFIKILRHNKTWYYPCFFLAGLLLGYTHIYGLLTIASQGFFFLLFWRKHRPQRIRLISTFAGMLICLLPLVILLGSNIVSITATGFWIPQPSLGSIADTLDGYTNGFWAYKYYPEDAGITFYDIQRLILLIVFLALAILSLFSIKKKEDKRKAKKARIAQQEAIHKDRLESGNKLLLILWFCFPIVIPFIASQIITPIYLINYTIGASLAFYLLVAKGISIFRKKSLYFILAIITIISSYGLHNYYTKDIRPQMREAADLVETKSETGDVLVFYAYYGQYLFDYYYTGDLDQYGLTSAGLQNIIALLDDLFYKADRVWLIVSCLEELPHFDELPLILSYLEDDYMLIDRTKFKGVAVFLFDLSRPAP
jgi:4-amino-4-deoxy-L-arabinose transferase-like glycosyltransferase